MRRPGVVVLAAALVALAAGRAWAGTVALTVTGGTTDETGGSQTMGWSFSTSGTITVTALGMWDYNDDGFHPGHPTYEVGIWADGGALLMSALVDTTDPLTGGYRFNSSLTGTTTLGPGTYVIGARFPGYDSEGPTDPFQVSTDAPVTAAGITYLENRTDGRIGASVLVRPDVTISGDGNAYFGPNFQFTTAAVAVPLPSAAWMGLVGLGALGLVLRLRRRKRKQLD